jgi:hypothetical protein
MDFANFSNQAKQSIALIFLKYIHETLRVTSSLAMKAKIRLLLQA